MTAVLPLGKKIWWVLWGGQDDEEGCLLGLDAVGYLTMGVAGLCAHLLQRLIPEGTTPILKIPVLLIRCAHCRVPTYTQNDLSSDAIFIKGFARIKVCSHISSDSSVSLP